MVDDYLLATINGPYLHRFHLAPPPKFLSILASEWSSPPGEILCLGGSTVHVGIFQTLKNRNRLSTTQSSNHLVQVFLPYLPPGLDRCPCRTLGLSLRVKQMWSRSEWKDPYRSILSQFNKPFSSGRPLQSILWLPSLSLWHFGTALNLMFRSEQALNDLATDFLFTPNAFSLSMDRVGQRP